MHPLRKLRPTKKRQWFSLSAKKLKTRLASRRLNIFHESLAASQDARLIGQNDIVTRDQIKSEVIQFLCDISKQEVQFLIFFPSYNYYCYYYISYFFFRFNDSCRNSKYVFFFFYCYSQNVSFIYYSNRS